MTGFRLPDSLVYDLFKGTRLGFRFGTHLAEAGYMLHSVADRVGPCMQRTKRGRRTFEYIVSIKISLSISKYLVFISKSIILIHYINSYTST